MRRFALMLLALVLLTGTSATMNPMWAAPQGVKVQVAPQAAPQTAPQAAKKPAAPQAAKTPAAPQAAKAQTKAPQLVTSVEGITEYRLANGLRVLLFPDPSKPSITVNVTYLVGSAEENYGETGMAHLLEHMLFKGSTRHTDIEKETTAHGAMSNASTWYDRTNYFEIFQATDENLKWALDLESDRMIHSFIAKKDLDSEMTVVRNEFETGENDPEGVLEERVMSTAYLWHNYGKSTIGARSDIENVPIERLQAFYHNWYQPDNAILLLAGKFDPAKTLEMVNSYFATVPAPTRKLPKIYTQEPTQDGERLVTLKRTGDVQAVMAAYHIPSGSHLDYAPLAVLTGVLGDSPSGRLYKALVESKKAASIFGFDFQLRDPGLALYGAEVRKESSLDDARDTLLKTIDAISSQPPTVEEVDRARTALLKNIELGLNNSQSVGLQISEWAAQGDWRLLFLHRDRLRKVTPDDVKRVAATYLKASNRTVGLFLPDPKPERAEIPATPNVAEMLKGYKGDAAIAQGEAFDPSPANIESRVKRSTLPNGLKVALLSKKTRGGTVVARMTFRYGDEQSLMNRSTQADVAASMLMRGTTKHTREQIKDEFDKLKARVGVGGGATQASATVETVRENLPATLRLLAEVLREPAFPEKEFEALRQEELAGIEQMKSEPQVIASLAMSRYLNPYPKGDVRYTPTMEEQIEEMQSVKLADAKKFYSDFLGASNGQISVVGDFDEAEITKVLADTLGSWKSPRAYQRVPSVYHDIPAVNKAFETPDKANAVFYAGLNIAMRDDDPDYPAMLLANYMMGGGSGLNSRLAVRIRQKEGLAYSVGSGFNASPLDKAGSFNAMATYAPQGAAKLETAFKEEMERALKDGFTAEEVKTAKSGWSQTQLLTRSQDGSVASRLSTYLFLGRTFQWDAALEKKVADLTPEQISAAMRKHIDPARITIFKAGDFAKAAAAKP